jgi:hypothetical protein
MICCCYLYLVKRITYKRTGDFKGVGTPLGVGVARNRDPQVLVRAQGETSPRFINKNTSVDLHERT